MIEIVLIQLVLVIGACLQGLLGLGLGLFSAPILFLLAPQYVPGPMILNALLLTMLIAARHRHAIDRQLTAFSMAGGAAGVLAAAVFITSLAFEHYRVLFGVLILCAVVLSWVGARPPINKTTNLIAGSLSGFIGTVTSAGGAPMGLLYQHAELKQRNANLSVFFLFINVFGIITLWLTGVSGWQDVLLFLQSVPALLLGWWLSRYVSRWAHPACLRHLILLVAFAAGCVTVWW